MAIMMFYTVIGQYVTMPCSDGIPVMAIMMFYTVIGQYVTMPCSDGIPVMAIMMFYTVIGQYVQTILAFNWDPPDETDQFEQFTRSALLFKNCQNYMI